MSPSMYNYPTHPDAIVNNIRTEQMRRSREVRKQNWHDANARARAMKSVTCNTKSRAVMLR